MKESPDRSPPQWSMSPNSRARNAVQRSVTALLDELAPERVLTRVERLAGPVEQHRTPTGCVLQAASSAVSVSWFSETSKEGTLGELHVLVWRGKVTRRGTPVGGKKAAVVAELVLHPIEPPADDFSWRTADGTRYSTASLAAKCLELLQAQVVSDT